MYEGIVDISHHQMNPDFVAAAAAGVGAVIHKATQGTSEVDPTYSTNRVSAKAAGLMFGSYHFGTGADGGAQANFFLNTVGPIAGELLALDFEENPAGSSMTLEEAKSFVTAIHDRLGIWPVLYSGHTLKDILGNRPDPVLANCPLWLAQYGQTAVLPIGWSKWTLWQWTDGAIGKPIPVPGIGHCDRDRFTDEVDDLATFWDSVSAPR